jgi:hypothetical protein
MLIVPINIGTWATAMTVSSCVVVMKSNGLQPLWYSSHSDQLLNDKPAYGNLHYCYT